MTAPRVGVASDVLPPLVATENMLCTPKDVRSERVQKGPAIFDNVEEGFGTPEVLATRALPGSTLPQNIPPWWSVESKSLLDSTTMTPFESR